MEADRQERAQKTVLGRKITSNARNEGFELSRIFRGNQEVPVENLPIFTPFFSDFEFFLEAFAYLTRERCKCFATIFCLLAIMQICGPIASLIVLLLFLQRCFDGYEIRENTELY